MEQTALRPKPMPGRDPGPGTEPDTGSRPQAGRRRRRRLLTVLLGVLTAMVLVLAGVGLGTVGATVIGMSKLAELQRQAGAPGPGGAAADGHGQGGGAGAGTDTRAAPADPEGDPSPSVAPAGATLGVEAVDDERPGARVVGVHVPGPGYAAGLVRGDVLLTVGTTRVDSAADLARAVARAEPGKEVKLTVRHRSGGYQQLTAVPGVVT
ncbi:PDZ domain-containing protein [Streptomyces sp. NPDC056353]|uniref:PDZ domain-containing protein n=1 Tax=Streptomyces sp. NPDC056353 TaxID=3345792 RepID=UPI0035DE7EB1